LGIGSGTDSGLINEIANVTHGIAISIHNSDDITEKVIAQLLISTSNPLTNSMIHIEGIDSFEIFPFPIPPLFPSQFATFFIQTSSTFVSQNPLFLSPSISDFLIDFRFEIFSIQNKSLLLSLFVFSMVNNLTFSAIDKYSKSKIIDLSVSNNVILRVTTFVGMNETATVDTKQLSLELAPTLQRTSPDFDPPRFRPMYCKPFSSFPKRKLFVPALNHFFLFAVPLNQTDRIHHHPLILQRLRVITTPLCP
jgi:hypothetical protein